MLSSNSFIKKSAVILLLMSFLYPNFILSYTLYRCGDIVSKESCCCTKSKNEFPKTTQFKKRDCCNIEKINPRPVPEALNSYVKLLITHHDYFQSVELLSFNNRLSESGHTNISPPGNTQPKSSILNTALRI
jgi:hypothetical protein